jgi:hypothetical protein
MIDAFNRCVNRLAETFKRRQGELTREEFRNICYEYKVDKVTAQAYFEAGGMKVEKLHKNEARLGDRFVWKSD